MTRPLNSQFGCIIIECPIFEASMGGTTGMGIANYNTHYTALLTFQSQGYLVTHLSKKILNQEGKFENYKTAVFVDSRFLPKFL